MTPRASGFERVELPTNYDQTNSPAKDKIPRYTSTFNSRHRKSTPQREVVEVCVDYEELSTSPYGTTAEGKKLEYIKNFDSRRRKSTPQMEVVEVSVIYEELGPSQKGNRTNILSLVNLEQVAPLTAENLKALQESGDEGLSIASGKILPRIHRDICSQLEQLVIRGLDVPAYHPFGADGSIRRNECISMGASAIIPHKRSEEEERRRCVIARQWQEKQERRPRQAKGVVESPPRLILGQLPQAGSLSESWEEVEDLTTAKGLGRACPLQPILGQLIQRTFDKPRLVYLEEQRKEEEDHERMNRIIDMEDDLFLPTLGEKRVAETVALMEKDGEEGQEEDLFESAVEEEKEDTLAFLGRKKSKEEGIAEVEH